MDGIRAWVKDFPPTISQFGVHITIGINLRLTHVAANG